MQTDEDVLQKIWDMPTVNEPVNETGESEETEEKTDEPIPCDGIARASCKWKAEAVLKVTWQPCACGKMKTVSYYCMDCFDKFPVEVYGGKRVRTGNHSTCGSPVLAIGVHAIK